MSDNIDFSTGRAGFANDTGETEWWGLPGAVLQPEDPVPTICQKGGLAFKVETAPVTYTTAKGKVMSFDNRVALYRDDTGAPLGFASQNRYHVHQNEELVSVLKQALGARMRTIGSLEGGRSVFACATVDETLTAPDGSKMMPYVTAHTRHDAGGATILADACTRPVCANTLAAVLFEANSRKRDYRVNHSVKLNAKELAKAFGLLGKVWQMKQEDWNKLAGKRFTMGQAHAFFASLMNVNLAEIGKMDAKGKPVVSMKAQNQLETLFEAYVKAPGAAPGTAWGALQAVTYYVDHESTVRDSYNDGEEKARLLSSQFGTGSKLKTFAEGQLLAMAA